MKNSNFFPFERNRYFYGKLLSVDDFELEQRYMNNKRRMLNRLLFGTGVVAGLSVVSVDEQTVSVEAGVALDAWGREIAVDIPVSKRLSMLEGFEGCRAKDAPYVYLCLEYDEQETERVHNIAGTVTAMQDTGELSCNKIREGYRLFLTTREPEKGLLAPEDWYRVTQTVYHEGDVRITQSMPRYINAGGCAEITVRVENLGRSSVAFSYEMVLNHLTAEGKAKLKVSFDEVLYEHTGIYEQTYLVRAAELVGEEAFAAVDPDTVSLRFSGVLQDAHMEGKLAAAIVGDGEQEAVRSAYYRLAMEELIRSGERESLYLAKIHLVSASDTYIIEKIENVPFGQYVSNQVLQNAMLQIGQKPAGLPQNRMSRRGLGEQGAAAQREHIRMVQGTAEIYINGGGQKGDLFYSEEIVHGLGLGRVTVVLGIQKENGGIRYGAAGIFREKESREPEAELAALVDENKGCITVGARLLSGTTGGRIRVRWTAYQDPADAMSEKNEKRIFIKPNLLELSVRQSHYLEAVCENMVEKAVSWSVKDEGGFIDENGLYTAPNTEGVYEVVAQSVAFPEIKASIFVVVRSEEQKEG